MRGPRRASNVFGESTMLDIDGYLTSQEFVAQLAAFISAIFSAVLGGLISAFFGGP